MESFLRQVAQHIYGRHKDALGQVTVIVPTRRAAFFMKRELGAVAGRPVVSPEIVTIDDFVSEASGLHTTETIHLLFELFEAFREVDRQVDFQRFIGWGSVLLNDFDRLDMALVKPEYLFDYLSEARALERWQQQSAADTKVTATPGTNTYFSLFGNIRKVYYRFRDNLREAGRAYPGMAYRFLAENSGLLAGYGNAHVYFAGFNAFTASEKEIVTYFVQSGRGELLWDSDAYYMEKNPLLEAGRSMREYRSRQTFGKEWRWVGNHLLGNEKTVHLYGVPNATLQTRVAGRLYSDILKRESNPGLTAIVLADENLLVPMLYSLEDSLTDLNVTMGLPLRNSLLYTLVDTVFELQQHMASRRGGEPRYNHRYITRLFSHPFIRFYDQIKEGQACESIARAISRRHLVYLSKADITDLAGEDPLWEVLLTKWPQGDAIAVIHRFYRIIDLLREVYRHQQDAMETEYLYLFYTLLQQFELTLENREKKLNQGALRQLLFELIRQTRIPFSGEPVSNLQVIGMLETRALDFDRVIILSLNEGVFPPRKSQHSLIPYDIARETGLPTYEYQEALSAYYFYRLLQRSGEIHLLYVNTPDAPGGGEKSRLLQQLEYEWAAYNPKAVILRHDVRLDTAAQEIRPLKLEKDAVVLHRIKHYLTEKGLYPTHIHLLILSPLDFYLRHVLGLQEEKETEETLGMDKIGTWLHDTFEALDKAFFLEGRLPTEEQITEELTRQFARSFPGYETATGLNSIYFQIGQQQMLAFMKAQHLREGHRWPVATEQNLRCVFELTCHGQQIPVRLGGKIDRVEAGSDGTLFVMDYKTGSVDVKSPRTLNRDQENRDQYLVSDPDYKMNYVRQLWLYQYLVYREMLEKDGWKLRDRTFNVKDWNVKSGFYSLRTPEKVTENPLQLAEGEGAEAYIWETERILGIILSRLLDPDIPLERNEDSPW